ncbi:TIGR03086 family metal-binding protein [Angustibacter luteus]|uniref:TIGR03086 family metal-binding protein n=1 Tax=Angustibacter luteus TaxID=658456 RepID=A0ABW1JES2_9ACTN
MPPFDLHAATAEVARVAARVRDDQLTAPTPSVDTVATLLDHLLGLCLAFTWGAQKQEPPVGGGPGPGSADGSRLDPGWRTELPQRLAALAAAWDDPAAWTGEATVGGVTMPGEVTASVALDEVVMHGWDLAVATGQEFTCDPVSAEVVLAFTAASAAPEAAPMRKGLFGPVVPVPDDAPAFARALGFAGRDPAWRPPTRD